MSILGLTSRIDHHRGVWGCAVQWMQRHSGRDTSVEVIILWAGGNSVDTPAGTGGEKWVSREWFKGSLWERRVARSPAVHRKQREMISALSHHRGQINVETSLEGITDWEIPSHLLRASLQCNYELELLYLLQDSCSTFFFFFCKTYYSFSWFPFWDLFLHRTLLAILPAWLTFCN